MKKHFYIFRHGQTIWNAEGRPQGQHSYPVPLTSHGKEQVALLAEKLIDKKIEKIISSDLFRAEQTSQIIGEAIGAEYQLDKRLREVDYGQLNGLYTIEREEVYPDFWRCYVDYSLKFPDGESLNQVAERMKEALVEIAKNSAAYCFGISTHGKAITALLRILFNHKLFVVSNCEYIYITYDTDNNLFEAEKLPPEQESGFESLGY